MLTFLFDINQEEMSGRLAVFVFLVHEFEFHSNILRKDAQHNMQERVLRDSSGEGRTVPQRWYLNGKFFTLLVA